MMQTIHSYPKAGNGAQWGNTRLKPRAQNLVALSSVWEFSIKGLRQAMSPALLLATYTCVLVCHSLCADLGRFLIAWTSPVSTMGSHPQWALTASGPLSSLIMCYLTSVARRNHRGRIHDSLTLVSFVPPKTALHRRYRQVWLLSLDGLFTLMTALATTLVCWSHCF